MILIIAGMGIIIAGIGVAILIIRDTLTNPWGSSLDGIGLFYGCGIGLLVDLVGFVLVLIGLLIRR